MPSTSDSDLELDPEISVPSGLELRRLEVGDFERGYLECLKSLTTVGDVSRRQFVEQFEGMIRSGNYHSIVIVDTSTSKVVASATLAVELKFIHACGSLGHIEDVVVSPEQRGRNLGRILVRQLAYLATRLGCYKITLDCDPSNQGFYEKCGLEKKGLQMVKYYHRS